MRLEVTIQDQIYSQTQRVASETGVRFDRFVSEAVQLRLKDEDPVNLTSEQVAIIRKGQAELRLEYFSRQTR